LERYGYVITGGTRPQVIQAVLQYLGKLRA